VTVHSHDTTGTTSGYCPEQKLLIIAVKFHQFSFILMHAIDYDIGGTIEFAEKWWGSYIQLLHIPPF